jgi:hypothetical protein
LSRRLKNYTDFLPTTILTKAETKMKKRHRRGSSKKNHFAHRLAVALGNHRSSTTGSAAGSAPVHKIKNSRQQNLTSRKISIGRGKWCTLKTGVHSCQCSPLQGRWKWREPAALLTQRRQQRSGEENSWSRENWNKSCAANGPHERLLTRGKEIGAGAICAAREAKTKENSSGTENDRLKTAAAGLPVKTSRAEEKRREPKITGPMDRAVRRKNESGTGISGKPEANRALEITALAW